ncbi:hypothetical protein O4J56_13510 [Nocardiopsis sp. RSe5-2]|uniref:Uncharacterized protein n=1 Tax=Nocardiopsis endophytica TaxID=3018445 RepID=A0ABT4U3W4_9ACTN|nr:hypothetical protein [Nocardiopsis endophytica]MDA2811652.1 hypothetical protein [Nocardiopsis endophytica]
MLGDDFYERKDQGLFGRIVHGYGEIRWMERLLVEFFPCSRRMIALFVLERKRIRNGRQSAWRVMQWNFVDGWVTVAYIIPIGIVAEVVSRVNPASGQIAYFLAGLIALPAAISGVLGMIESVRGQIIGVLRKWSHQMRVLPLRLWRIVHGAATLAGWVLATYNSELFSGFKSDSVWFLGHL